MIATITLSVMKCLRCTHQWFPRSIELPKVCPLCKSPYWNTPRGTVKPGPRPKGKTK